MIFLLLTVASFGQSRLILFDSGTTYNGTELITNAIDRTMELGDELLSNSFEWTGATGTTPPTGWTQRSSPNTGTFAIVDEGGDYTTALLLTADVGMSNPAIYRSFTTIAGQRYLISYAYKKGTGTSVRVGVGTVGLGFTLYDVTSTNATWTPVTGRFTASGTTTYNTLLSSESATLGNYIDNVSVKSVSNYLSNGNHTVDTSTVYKQAGSYSGKIVATAAGNGTTNTISLASTLFTAVTNGTNYRFQVYAYTSTANTVLTFKLGDITKTATVSTVGMSVINFDFQATASTTGNILLYLDKAATVYIDNISLKSGS